MVAAAPATAAARSTDWAGALTLAAPNGGIGGNGGSGGSGISEPIQAIPKKMKLSIASWTPSASVGPISANCPSIRYAKLYTPACTSGSMLKYARSIAGAIHHSPGTKLSA